MHASPPTVSYFTRRNFDQIPQLGALPGQLRVEMKAAASVFPFRVNTYVLDELIDWSSAPDDPMFQLAFPQPGMLSAEELDETIDLLRGGAPRAEFEAHTRRIQRGLNPHPAEQRTLNVPRVGGVAVEGVQHKYAETVLFFPSAGQVCHTYCTYCFRWPQFVGLKEERFAARESARLVAYLKEHEEVTDVLITGGDPMVMKAHVLRRYVEPLLTPELSHVTSIRVGTKSLSTCPGRYVHDEDADDLLSLFEEVRASGRNLALMAHVSHPVELSTPLAKDAFARVQRAGAVVRCQAPLIRHVNDDADTWARMWRAQVRLGAVPYYMFVERDTGPRHYFEVPLAQALDIFTGAYAKVSGLARTVRGPVMSCTPGKVLVDGVLEHAGERHFVLKMLQGRRAGWVNRTLLAGYDAEARWIDDLRASGDEAWPWAEEMEEMRRLAEAGGQDPP